MCEDIFEEWLHMVSVLQQLSFRKSVKVLSKHLSMDLAIITKKVQLLDKKQTNHGHTREASLTPEFIQMCENSHSVAFCNQIKQEIIKSKCQPEA